MIESDVTRSKWLASTAAMATAIVSKNGLGKAGPSSKSRFLTLACSYLYCQLYMWPSVTHTTSHCPNLTHTFFSTCTYRHLFPSVDNLYVIPSERWAAYVDPDTGYGLGVFVPTARGGITAYRFGDRNVGFPWYTSYFAHIVRLALKPGMKPYRYQVFITVGKIDEIRRTFYKLASNPKILHPDMLKEIPNYFLADKNEAAQLDLQPALGRNSMGSEAGIIAPRSTAAPAPAAVVSTQPNPTDTTTIASDDADYSQAPPAPSLAEAEAAAAESDRNKAAGGGGWTADAAVDPRAASSSSGPSASGVTSRGNSEPNDQVASGSRNRDGDLVEEVQGLDPWVGESNGMVFFEPGDARWLQLHGANKLPAFGLLVGAVAVVALVGVAAVKLLAHKRVLVAGGRNTAAAAEAAAAVAVAAMGPAKDADHVRGRLHGCKEASEVVDGIEIGAEGTPGAKGVARVHTHADCESQKGHPKGVGGRGPRSSAHM